MKYYFYQDESGHDIKLSNKESGFNFEINNQTAYFTNAFLGIPVNELDKFEKRFIELELKYKKVLGIQSDVEFKAESIKNKNFKFGLSTMDLKYINFYNELFDLIDDNYLIQISIKNKFEFMLLQCFQNEFSNTLSEYIYGFIKFLDRNKTKNIRKLLTNEETTIIDLYQEVVQICEKFIIHNGKNEKLQLELNYAETLQAILSSLIENINPQEKYDFDYSGSFKGLLQLFHELGLEGKDLILYIDGKGHKTDKLYNNAKEVLEGYQIERVDSINSSGTRMVDFISNLISRMMRSIELEVKETETGILRDSWFRFRDEKIFLTLKKLGELFNKRSQIYNTTNIGIYSDVSNYFFRYIAYISGFNTFHEFNDITPREHATNVSMLTIGAINYTMSQLNIRDFL